MNLLRRRLPLLCLLPFAACAGMAPEETPLPSADYGSYARTVHGASAPGQAWFDHGLTLVYGFNHEEGILAFTQAAELDPECAMAWWGIAYGNGVDVNNMAVSDAEAELGAKAARKASELVGPFDGAPKTVEQGLIHAVAARAVTPMPEDRTALDEEYAARMGALWRAFPHDADVGALYAEALMNLQPWDYWTADGSPVGRAEEIVDVLEAALALVPDHPGANHFYIHAVEASKAPERAATAARILETRIPGSGHLVHMPSHVYIATGRYEEAVLSNQAAIQADEAYFDIHGRPDFYSLYFLHNIHFLSFAAMMEGRSALALEAVTKMEAEVPAEFVRDFPQFADGLLPTRFHVLIRFGRWEEILAIDEFPEFRHVSRSVRRYARAIAMANLGRTGEARAELDAFDREAAQVPESWDIGVNSASVVLALSRQVAEGEVLFKEGRIDAALDTLLAAQAAEDALVYDEPPGWMLPVRHARGALLLTAGRHEEAEAVYREDLLEWPRNGWSLLGRQQALRLLGRTEDAEVLQSAVDSAWSRADVTPPASCYCGAPDVRHFDDTHE